MKIFGLKKKLNIERKKVGKKQNSSHRDRFTIQHVITFLSRRNKSLE